MPTDKLVTITRVSNSEARDSIVINPSKYQFGRSAYVCKSSECIKITIKGKKISKMLRVPNEACNKVVSFLEENFLKEGVLAV